MISCLQSSVIDFQRATWNTFQIETMLQDMIQYAMDNDRCLVAAPHTNLVGKSNYHKYIRTIESMINPCKLPMRLLLAVKAMHL